MKIGELTFEPTWRSDTGGYFQEVRRCGSLVIQKRGKKRKTELDKSASQTQSIMNMFSAQHKQNEGHHLASFYNPLFLSGLSQSSSFKMIKSLKPNFV